jgi:cell fate regulator YaaT (PSP1 superfamily)
MLVQFFEWSTPENVVSSLADLKKGDKVVVQHKWGILIGTVVGGGGDGKEIAGQILHKATAQDFETALKNKQKEKLFKKDIKKKVREAKVPMKIVDTVMSIDGGCLVVVFTADNRVDFRELVKDISGELGKSVRFQQVGARDEAKKMGGFGICGRELCCSKFSRGLRSITTDMARSQSIAHRGSERLSGLCGRLMCCLSYESKQYEESSVNMPTRGDVIFYEKKEAKVMETLVLDQKIKILLPDGKMIVVDLEKIIIKR